MKISSLIFTFIKKANIMYFNNIVQKFFFIKQIIKLLQIYNQIPKINEILIDDYLKKNLYENSRYKDAKKINKFEYQVFSQNGEDGIIEEIFKRIGVTNKYFVEFGVGNGLENNTTYLLSKNWSGCWIEGNTYSVKQIQEKFSSLINNKKLMVQEEFITAENIENIFRQAGLPYEFDLLSIDIDGNDYWVWKAITNYKPRVVAIEYNALFPPHVQWVMEYDAKCLWDGTSYFNSSLKSLELLAKEKGYKLVGCNFTGVNAFFVREDLMDDNFCEPFTSENHYEPPRYFLYRKIAHKRGFGNFLTI